MNNLTPQDAPAGTRRKVYDYMRGYALTHHGHMPTLRAIAAAVGLSAKSPGTVQYHIDALIQDGLLASHDNGDGRPLYYMPDTRLVPAAGLLDKIGATQDHLAAEIVGLESRSADIDRRLSRLEQTLQERANG